MKLHDRPWHQSPNEVNVFSNVIDLLTVSCFVLSPTFLLKVERATFRRSVWGLGAARGSWIVQFDSTPMDSFLFLIYSVSYRFGLFSEPTFVSVRHPVHHPSPYDPVSTTITALDALASSRDKKPGQLGKYRVGDSFRQTTDSIAWSILP